MSIFVNRDGTTEAWDGDNYVALGSMRPDPPKGEPRPRVEATFPPQPHLYIEIEEFPPLTIDEFQMLAEIQRKRRMRERRFNKLMQATAEALAARRRGAES